MASADTLISTESRALILTKFELPSLQDEFSLGLRTQHGQVTPEMVHSYYHEKDAKNKRVLLRHVPVAHAPVRTTLALLGGSCQHCRFWRKHLADSIAAGVSH